MKPSKHRVYCQDCGRHKLNFESEKKANTFIKFNSEDIEEESGYAPKRVYYCISCGGWHLTSNEQALQSKSRSERMIERYEKDKEKRALEKERATKLRLEKAPEITKRLHNVRCLIKKAKEYLEESNLSQCTVSLNGAATELKVAWTISGREKAMKKLRIAINELREKVKIIGMEKSKES